MNRLSFMTVALYQEYAAGQKKEDIEFIYGEIFREVRNAGYEWVDLSSWEADALGTGCLASLLEKYGLKVSSYIFFEDYAEVEKSLEKCLDRAADGVNCAAALGSSFFMIGIQDRGNIRNTDPVLIREKLIAYFTGICRFAKEKDICPIIENIPDLALGFCESQDVRSLLDAVPSLGYIFDSGTLLVAEEAAQRYLTTLKDRLVYVHLKDMKETFDPDGFAFPSRSGRRFVNAPPGKGQVDFHGILIQLEKAGYQGRFSVEFCPDPDLTLADSIRRSTEYLLKPFA